MKQLTINLGEAIAERLSFFLSTGEPVSWPLLFRWSTERPRQQQWVVSG